MLLDQSDRTAFVTCFKEWNRQKAKGLFALLAKLVCNTAGGFASGLARGLALAAAAGLEGLLEVAGLKRFNSFHGEVSFEITANTI